MSPLYSSQRDGSFTGTPSSLAMTSTSRLQSEMGIAPLTRAHPDLRSWSISIETFMGMTVRLYLATKERHRTLKSPPWVRNAPNGFGGRPHPSTYKHMAGMCHKDTSELKDGESRAMLSPSTNFGPSRIMACRRTSPSADHGQRPRPAAYPSCRP
jgi:hypothetical protein